MAIELQIQSAVLGEITARAAQAQLMKACFPPLGETDIDHIDVGSAPVQLMGADAGVRMRLPLDAYQVKRKDVLATPNGVPAGATSPAGSVAAIVKVSASGASLAGRTARCRARPTWRSRGHPPASWRPRPTPMARSPAP